jgi:hypothetical protein
MRLGDEALTNTGIMGVVPVWKLQELLDYEEVRDMRLRVVDEMAKAEGDSAKLDIADEGDEFERFRSLTQRIVQVPKSEIDEKRETT